MPDERDGYYQGRKYFEYAEDVRQLKRTGRLLEAEALLLELVRVVEEEASEHDWGVAPWYYEQLAIIYAKQKRFEEELQILRRYAGKRHAPGAKPSKLVARLAKLEAKLAK